MRETLKEFNLEGDLGMTEMGRESKDSYRAWTCGRSLGMFGRPTGVCVQLGSGRG